jgi:hypothetical protein
VFGRSLETVLSERPCRVIIQTVPRQEDAPVPAAA